ncbi:aminotransferase [Morchella snyderi]|nr:aminotransferase [Morchella snyderi]
MTSTKVEDFSLFSSLRHDRLLLQSPENTTASGSTTPCPFYLLEYHRDRMVRAAHHFEWSEAATAPLEDLNEFRRACEEAVGTQTCPLRVRTVLSPEGKLSVTVSPIPPVPVTILFPSTLPNPSSLSSPPLWKIHIDTISTASSLFTSHKTTFRDHYDAARLRAGIINYTDTTEVALWNEDGVMMEGSITSVYFWRNGVWVTPPLESGGNNGTTRRWLLEKGMVIEAVVRKESIEAGEVVLISNGVRGIWAGTVV